MSSSSVAALREACSLVLAFLCVPAPLREIMVLLFFLSLPLRETCSFVLAFPCASAPLREIMLLAFIHFAVSA
jgi:hypothetical protein